MGFFHRPVLPLGWEEGYILIYYRSCLHFTSAGTCQRNFDEKSFLCYRECVSQFFIFIAF